MPSSYDEKKSSPDRESPSTQTTRGQLKDGDETKGDGHGRQPLNDEVTPAAGHKKQAVVDDEKSRHSTELDEEDLDADHDSTHGENEDPESGVPARTQSRASSSRSRPIVVVPRSERRGLFGRFTILPEITIPYDYTNNTKWFITILVAFCGFAAPIGSAIFFRESLAYGFSEPSYQRLNAGTDVVQLLCRRCLGT